MSEYRFPNGFEVTTVSSAPIGDDVTPVTSRKRTIVPLPRLPKIQPKNPPAKAKFSDIFTKTDINGFPDWYEAPNWSLKIAWTIILLAAITLLTLELVHTIRDFLDNPILTTYSLVNEPEGMKFPEVYLCPTNPIHKKQHLLANVEGLWETKNADGLLKALSNITGLAGLLRAKATQSELLAASRLVPVIGDRPVMPSVGVTPVDVKYVEPPELWIPDKIEDYFKAVGYPLETFIRECSFNGKPLNCTEVITEVFDVDYGKCFLIKVLSRLSRFQGGSNKFNLRRVLIEDGFVFSPKYIEHNYKIALEFCQQLQLNTYQSVGGVGLSLVLDLDFANGYPEAAKPQPFSDGVLLKVGEKVDAGTSGSLQLMPATYSKVALSSRKMNLIDRVRHAEAASQLCTDDKEADKKMKILKENFYSMDSCIQDCHQVHVVENCSCYLPVDRRFINDHILTKESMDVCIPKMLKGCAADILKERKIDIEECTSGCNLPCNYWEYQMSLSASAFPTHNLRKNAFPDGPPDVDGNGTPPEAIQQPAHLCSVTPHRPERLLKCPPRSAPPTLALQSNTAADSAPPAIDENGAPASLPPILFTEPNSTTMWYWNRTEEDCRSRQYLWCPQLEGDPRNQEFITTFLFSTRSQCLNNCGYGNPCLALANFPVGSDGKKQNRYAYHLKEGRCVRYHGYGILATENNFDTRERCEQKCNGTKDDPCNADSSRCTGGDAYFTFSVAEKRCVQQTALTPADNCTLTPTGNHYRSPFVCSEHCAVFANDATLTDLDSANCTGPAFKGDGKCMELECRYYHASGVCKKFDYIGCPLANGNAFKTKEECENKCATSIVKPIGWKSTIPHLIPTSNVVPKREDIQGASKLNIDASKWSQGDMIVLDIAFSSLQYIELTQEPSMTFTTFVSNVGGQVGLWVGCSVVTIVKLFLVVMPLCLRCRKKNSQTEQTEDTTA